MSVIHRSRPIVAVLILGASILLAGPARADITTNVFAHSAPNEFGSPSWPGFLDMAMPAIDNGSGSSGDRNTDPTAYVEFAPGQFISPIQLIESDFLSWLGVANPSAPFELEMGNRLHFGVNIFSDDGTQFRLGDLSFEMSSSDSGNALGLSVDFANSTYSSSRIGIDYGADHTRGGGDDTVYMSGESAAMMVNELIYVGVGNGFDASSNDPLTDQEKLDQTIEDILDGIRSEGPIDVFGVYFLTDPGGAPLSGGGSFVTLVPEPGAFTLLTLISLACLGVRRRIG